jgi:hypothetical protein
MSRWVIPKKSAGLFASDSKEDGALKRFVKYIPSEIVTAYTLLFSALTAVQCCGYIKPIITLYLMALFFVVTIIYVARSCPKNNARLAHIFVSPIAFIAWAYPISGSLLDEFYSEMVTFGLQVLIVVLALVVAPKE